MIHKRRKINYKYETPKCPICRENKYVISDGNGSAYGMAGISRKGSSGEGGDHCYLYCTECYVDFDIKTTYKKYTKDKRIGMTGRTGCQ